MKIGSVLLLLLVLLYFYYRGNCYQFKIEEVENSFISKLKNNEFVAIQYERYGCFSYDKDAITISRINDFFYLDSNTKKRKKLTRYDLEKLIRFECQLYEIPKGGCTTAEKYSIILNGKTKTFFDETCRLHLWNNLTVRSFD